MKPSRPSKLSLKKKNTTAMTPPSIKRKSSSTDCPKNEKYSRHSSTSASTPTPTPTQPKQSLPSNKTDSAPSTRKEPDPNPKTTEECGKMKDGENNKRQEMMSRFKYGLIALGIDCRTQKKFR